ncbi:GGDEF domain-containing protein [Pseudorhodoferax sp. Leaf274]|uniref:GGDEF domain-containing protein n=1 Tax=Pseudorhodoferax sp. Leaf274 TaxID=1736318 RepID=UPI0007036AE0|nr:GGDEF domain-containing protein [Pseudorhodoferax sp. Leaf274]KQP38889.1 hypothetical protein ASF44_10625 [Pseudorhodoferax sp. Leaf274]
MRDDRLLQIQSSIADIRRESVSGKNDEEIKDQLRKIFGRRLVLSTTSSFLGYGTQAFLLREIVPTPYLVQWISAVFLLEMTNGIIAYAIQSEKVPRRIKNTLWKLVSASLGAVALAWGSIVLAPGVTENPSALLVQTMSLAVVAVMAIYNLNLHKFGLAIFHICLSSSLVYGAMVLKVIPADLSIAAVALTVLCQIYGTSTRKMVRSLVVTNAVNKKMVMVLDQANTNLQNLAHELHLAASIDVLTSCLNRRAMHDELERAFTACKRSGRLSICLIMLDIDHFKKINDEHGHDGGDLVLIAIGRALREFTRACDVVGRWGGEEFMCLMMDADNIGGTMAAEKLRKRIAEMRIDLPTGQIVISASLGVASYANDASVNDVIRRADQHLYAAKAQGRNCVVSASAATRPNGATAQRMLRDVHGTPQHQA